MLLGEATKSNKILIVEDEFIIAESLKENLEEKGYEITSINTNLEEALSNIERERPDLVLLDINLKGKRDGIEIAQKTKDIPIIFLTSNTDQEIQEEAINCSPYGYIQKGNINEDFYISIDLAINKNHLVTKYKNYVDVSKKYLQQKSTELEEFTYNISHIIKGPISTIKGIVNLSSYDNNFEFLKMIDMEADKLSNNLNKLITYIYVTNKNLKLNEHNINNLLCSSLQNIKSQHQYKDVNINIIHNKHNTIYTDKVILDTIIYEIIENGLKFNYNEPSEKWVEISYDLKEHGNKTIKITDNGVGIEDYVLDRIFDLFFRGNECSSGSGIGLYMAVQLADKINATISIDYSRPANTCFSINFK